MKISLYVLGLSLILAFMLAPLSGSVSAQVPTITATASATITPTIDPYVGACPVFPDGFDFSSLPLDYVARCGECIPDNLTPLPTSIFPTVEISPVVINSDVLTEYPTDTPSPVVTSTLSVSPTVTVVPTATAPYSGYLACDGDYCSQSGGTLVYSGSSPWQGDGLTLAGQFPFEFTTFTTGTLYWRLVITAVTGLEVEYFAPLPDLEVTYRDLSYTSGLLETLPVDLLSSGGGGGGGYWNVPIGVYEGSYPIDFAGDASFIFSKPTAFSSRVGLDAGAVMYISFDPSFSLIPAAPTPTPVYGFCSDIPDLMDYTPIVDTDGLVTVTAGECFIILPEISIDIPAVEPIWGGFSLHQDGIRVCPNYVTVNSLRVGDVSIPDGMFAIGLAWAIYKLIF